MSPMMKKIYFGGIAAVLLYIAYMMQGPAPAPQYIYYQSTTPSYTYTQPSYAPRHYTCPSNGYTSGQDGWCYKTF